MKLTAIAVALLTVLTGLTAAPAPAAAQYTTVSPYIRSDGTVVRGHIRSLPNGTCSDNINGCR